MLTVFVLCGSASGYYCASTSNAGPTGPCTAGWYCTGSSDSPIQFASPAGYYSINGSSAAIPCGVGTYAPSANSSSCALCDAGFFCPNQTSVFLTECPKGAYCVQGSSFPTSCLPGFYNPFAQGKNLTACLPCPAGSYCADNGMWDVSGPCAAGFYCQTQAQSPTPGSLAQGGLPCPPGQSLWHFLFASCDAMLVDRCPLLTHFCAVMCLWTLRLLLSSGHHRPCPLRCRHLLRDADAGGSIRLHSLPSRQVLCTATDDSSGRAAYLLVHPDAHGARRLR